MALDCRFGEPDAVLREGSNWLSATSSKSTSSFIDLLLLPFEHEFSGR